MHIENLNLDWFIFMLYKSNRLMVSLLFSSCSRNDCKSKNDSIELSDVSVNSPDKFQSVDCLELASEIVVKKVNTFILYNTFSTHSGVSKMCANEPVF